MNNAKAQNPTGVSLQVNGESIKLSSGNKICDLLAQLDFVPSSVLLEVNGEALLRSEWNSIQLKNNDRIEILKVVAGG